MFKLMKRTLAAAAAVVAATAPSTAYARFELNPAPAPAPPGGAQIQTASSPPAQSPVRASATRSQPPSAQTSSADGFQWGDAGLGAAGILVLLGTGVGSATVITRRRADHTRLS